MATLHHAVPNHDGVGDAVHVYADQPSHPLACRCNFPRMYALEAPEGEGFRCTEPATQEDGYCDECREVADWKAGRFLA